MKKVSFDPAIANATSSVLGSHGAMLDIPYWIQSFLNTLSFIQDNKMETNYLVDYIIVQNFDLEQQPAYPILIHLSA